MKKLRIYLLLLSALFLVLQSCQTEELPIETDGPLAESDNTINASELPAEIRAAIQDTEVALKHPDLGLKGVPFGEPDLSLINISETDGATSYTMLLPKVGKGLYFDNLIVQKDPDGTVYAQIQRYEPEPQWWAQQDVSAPRYDNFNGTVRFYNGTGEAFAAAELVDGTIYESVSMTTATGRSGCVIVDIQYAGVVVGGHFHVTEIRTTYACGSGDGGGNYGGDDDYGDDGHNGGGGFGGNGNGGGEPTNTDPIVDDNGNFNEDPEIVEVKLKDETNDPCVSDIIKKLQLKDHTKLTIPDIGGLSGTGHLSQGILDLFDGLGNYDLTFKVAEAGTNSAGQLKNATTVKTPGRNEWTVTIDDDYARKATQLSIARTIIHESVHAFIGYILKSNNSSSLAISITSYYNSLSSNNLSSGVRQNLTEHEFIGQYVEGIANSLSIWDSKRQPLSYYKKMAWGGLESSTAYNAQLNKMDIQKIINNEATANTNAKGQKCP